MFIGVFGYAKPEYCLCFVLKPTINWKLQYFCQFQITSLKLVDWLKKYTALTSDWTGNSPNWAQKSVDKPNFFYENAFCIELIFHGLTILPKTATQRPLTINTLLHCISKADQAKVARHGKICIGLWLYVLMPEIIAFILTNCLLTHLF